jgi:hypothetical protein
MLSQHDASWVTLYRSNSPEEMTLVVDADNPRTVFLLVQVEIICV